MVKPSLSLVPHRAPGVLVKRLLDLSGGEKGVSDPLVGDHREIIYSHGAGGSIAWADIRDRIAVSICHNNMDAGISVDPEPIWAPIGRAVREVIADLDSSS